MSLTISPAQIVEESGSPLLAAPAHWLRRPLGEVATILNGFAFASKQFASDRGKPLIRIRDIFNDRTAVAYVGEYDNRYLVNTGELLVGMDGDFNCTRWRGPEALLNQRVCKITPDPSQLDFDFLTYVLPGYLQAIHDLTSSTTVTHLSSRDVTQIPIPVPPLEEQRQLSLLLGVASSKQRSSASHLAAACRAVDRFRQSVLSAACSGRLTADWREPDRDRGARLIEAARARRRAELGRRYREPDANRHADSTDLPASWGASPLGLLLIDIKYGTSKRSEYVAPGIPILRIPNVSGERLNTADLKFADLDAREADSLRLRLGDILIIRSNGSPQFVGKSALVDHRAVGMAYAGYLMRLRVDEEVAVSEFVALALASPQLRHQIEMPLRSTSGVNNINFGEVRGLVVPVPPIEEQREIVRRVDQLLTLADALKQRINTASKDGDLSSQAVLVKAFRGELSEPTLLSAGRSN